MQECRWRGLEACWLVKCIGGGDDFCHYAATWWDDVQRPAFGGLEVACGGRRNVDRLHMSVILSVWRQWPAGGGSPAAMTSSVWQPFAHGGLGCFWAKALLRILPWPTLMTPLVPYPRWRPCCEELPLGFFT
jgi:hypothetical protein